MGRNNWEPEDGMGFAGMVPTLAEKREETDRERAFARELKLRQSLVDAENRNRELTRRTEALQAALRHIAYNLSLSVPCGCDEASHNYGQLREAIRTAVRALTAPPSSAQSDDRADTGREET